MAQDSDQEEEGIVIDDEALTRNVASPRQVKAATKKQKQREREEREDLSSVMTTPAGRRLLWRWLQFCGTFESVISDNPLVMAHNSGRQDVGHMMMAEMTKANPQAYLEMSLDPDRR